MTASTKREKNENLKPYLVSSELFQESSRIKDSLELFEKRLKKIEEHRSSVSEPVYFRVKTDYETQLDEIRSEFQAKSQEIEQDLTRFYQSQEEQQNLRAKHQETLEEAKFRHMLEEYGNEKFQEIETQENQQIKKFDEILNTIQNSIDQYEKVLGRSFKENWKPTPKPVETKATKAPAPAAEKAATPTSTPPAPQVETKSETDELDDFLQTEGDYFNAGGEIPEEAPAPTPLKKAEAEPVPVQEDFIADILSSLPLESDAPETPSSEESTGATIDTRGISEATLLVLEGELDEHEYQMGETTSFGRSPSNDVVLKEAKVSRQHAVIHHRDGQYVLVDLKSSNGVAVNDVKVEEATLNDGDQIQMGSFKFQFNLM